MIFQSQLTTLDNELSELQALLKAKQQQRTVYTELQQQTEGYLQGLSKLKDRIAGTVGTDAIASLKSAVIQLFTDNDNDTDDGGNQPIGPTPNDGDDGDDGEFELIALNGETGDCLTTAELDDPIPDNPVGDEHILPSVRPLAGQKCDIDPALYWVNAQPDGSAWELMTPFACPIDPQPRPLPSTTEMVHTSARTGYLKLKEDGRILSAYAWFSRKAIAEAWFEHFDMMSIGKPELRHSQRNSSFKYEIKLTGLSMRQIERLASEPLHQKPTKRTESPAQVAGIEPPSDWGKVQQPEESKFPPCPFVEGDIVNWNGSELRVQKIGRETLYCTFPHEPEETKHHTKAPIAECTPVQPVEQQPEQTIPILGEGDTCEVLSGRYKGQVGTVASFNQYSELPIALNLPGGHVKHFHRCDVKLTSKAEPAKRKQPEPGRVLIGNRIVTTGNYIGTARRAAILNARNNVAEKIATLQVMRDLQADGLDPRWVLVTDDAADF